MKYKNIKKLTTCSFLSFIGILSITNIFTPHQEFSPDENRTLAKFPNISFDTILSGKFDNEFETWFSDQFIQRNRWIMLKSFTKKIGGSIENNNVYYGKDGSLISQFQTMKTEQLEKNIAAIKTFAEKNHVTANLLFIPTAVQMRKHVLPFGAFDINQKELLDEMTIQFENQNFISIYDSLNQENEDFYFHTDHHWNHKGALLGYEAIAKQVLQKEPEPFTAELVDEQFYGTMYSKSGAFWSQADQIYKIVPQNETSFEVIYDNGTVIPSIYSENRLREKDKYMYYLDGNHANVTIKTSNQNHKKALIIKDSYAHILMPYLAQEYEEINLIDLRYYRTAVSPLLTPDTDVYFIYSLDNFAQDTNLVFLR